MPHRQYDADPKGILTAVSAFVLWGLFPFYFKMLKAYSATEIIAHRIVWTLVCCVFIIWMLRKTQNQWLSIVKKEPKWLVLVFVASWLMASNWLMYVWAVNHDQVLEASLGYFICPLLGIFLALIFFKERLRKLQIFAVSFAGLSVLLQLIMLGHLPLLSLAIAATFAVYGMLHKKMPVPALPALFLETLFVFPFVVLWLVFFAPNDVQSSHISFWLSNDIWFLMLAGPITLLPLLLYNKSTKMVPFTLLSFANYITPSMIFLLAVFYYKESFDATKFMLFGLIWVGLALFSLDLWLNRPSQKGIKLRALKHKE